MQDTAFTTDCEVEITAARGHRLATADGCATCSTLFAIGGERYVIGITLSDTYAPPVPSFVVCPDCAREFGA